MPPIPSDQVSLKPYARFGFDPVVPLKDAASIAGCHVQTLKNEARRGKLLLIRISERRIGVRESEFNRYLSSRVWANGKPKLPSDEPEHPASLDTPQLPQASDR